MGTEFHLLTYPLPLILLY